LVITGRSDVLPLCAEEKIGFTPTDRGKGSVKRGLPTEPHGILVAVVIDAANRHDMKLVMPTLANLNLDLPRPTSALRQGLCPDKGYDYDEVRGGAEIGFTAQIRVCGQEAVAIKQEAGVRATRWVVERTHS
jgi:putative transposase